MASRLLRPLARALWKFDLHRKDFVASRQLLLVSALLFGGLLSARASEEPSTLRNSAELPVGEIEGVLPHEAWELIKDRKYVAYVVFEGGVDRKGSVKIRKQLRAHPDNSWMKHVPQAIKGVQFLTTGVASRVPARVKTCVVFYPAPTGYTALVFIAQDDAVTHMATTPPYAGLASIEIPAKDRQTK